jgi:hypothetical protein
VVTIYMSVQDVKTYKIYGNKCDVEIVLELSGADHMVFTEDIWLCYIYIYIYIYIYRACNH